MKAGKSEAELRLEFASYGVEYWKGIQRRNALENAVLRTVLWFLAAVNVALWIGLAVFLLTH